MNIRKLILLLSLFIVLCVNAQPVVYKKAAHDLTPFTGTWIASKGDMKYEITFEKGTLDLEIDVNYTIEVVLASAKWFKGGKMIREVKINGQNSILQGLVAEKDPLYLSIAYSDKEYESNFSGDFIIDSVKPLKAKLTIYTALIITKGPRDTTYEFPTTLEFTKTK